MLDSIPVILLVSTVLGFFAGLGIGGGSLLVLWLGLVIGMDPATVRGINLLFFLPSAAVTICFRRKQGFLPWKKILPAILAGCITALGFSWLGRYFDITILKKLFGILLIGTGLRELLYRPRKFK